MFTLVHHDLSTEHLSLGDLLKRSTWTLLYFYPKDDTPGCTLEGQEFSKFLTEFQHLHIQIVGVSKDTPDKHCAFISKYSLTPDYLSDPTLELHKKFGARGTKKMYGKEVEGTIRSTVLLDQT